MTLRIALRLSDCNAPRDEFFAVSDSQWLPIAFVMLPRTHKSRDYEAKCCAQFNARRSPRCNAPAQIRPGVAAAEIEHRTFDHRWLPQHQCDRFLGIDAILVLVRQLAKGGAGAIEQRLPTGLLRPLFEPRALDAGALVIVKVVIDAVLVEPGARRLHP